MEAPVDRAAEAAQHQQEIAAKDQRIRQEVAISNRLRVSWNEDVGAARAESEQLACEIEAMGSRAEQAIAALHARLAAVEAERDALERLRVHCEHCGADYAATGVEAGCPCLVRAERDRLKAALSASEARIYPDASFEQYLDDTTSTLVELVNDLSDGGDEHAAAAIQQAVEAIGHLRRTRDELRLDLERIGLAALTPQPQGQSTDGETR